MSKALHTFSCVCPLTFLILIDHWMKFRLQNSSYLILTDLLLSAFTMLEGLHHEWIRDMYELLNLSDPCTRRHTHQDLSLSCSTCNIPWILLGSLSSIHQSLHQSLPQNQAFWIAEQTILVTDQIVFQPHLKFSACPANFKIWSLFLSFLSPLLECLQAHCPRNQVQGPFVSFDSLTFTSFMVLAFSLVR